MRPNGRSSACSQRSGGRGVPGAAGAELRPRPQRFLGRARRWHRRGARARPRVEGVYPGARRLSGRIVRPRRCGRIWHGSDGAGPGISLPGFDGRGVVVALLDTGIDVAHPYLQDRLLPGIDILDPTAGAVAPSGTRSRPGASRRTRPSSPGSSRARAAQTGLHGVAPGASILPIRVAGWQPDVDGGVAVYGRTDQVLAGIEAAVDPERNGDAHDAARVALVGVVEPDAAFADGPLALAGAGAQALDTLVVAPARKRRACRAVVRDLSGAGGHAGCADRRGRGLSDRERPTAHVLLRSGSSRLSHGETAARCGADGARAARSRAASASAIAVTTGNALVRLFDAGGYSTRRGRRGAAAAAAT